MKESRFRDKHTLFVPNFETSKMNNIIILVKRDKLTPYGDYRLQRINAG